MGEKLYEYTTRRTRGLHGIFRAAVVGVVMIRDEAEVREGETRTNSLASSSVYSNFSLGVLIKKLFIQAECILYLALYCGKI